MRRRAALARDPGSVEAARQQALRLLERRPQAERELGDKLRRRGYLPDVVETVVAKLRATGLVNDEKFSALFARSRVLAKPVGRRFVAAKLTAHGIDRKLAESAAGAAVAEMDEKALAQEAARRYLKRRPFKFAGKRTPESVKERNRMFGYLVRQGFDTGMIRRVMRVEATEEKSGGADFDDLG